MFFPFIEFLRADRAHCVAQKSQAASKEQAVRLLGWEAGRGATGAGLGQSS